MDPYAEDEEEVDVRIPRGREDPTPFYRYVQQPTRRGSGFAEPSRGPRRSSTLPTQDDPEIEFRRRENIRGEIRAREEAVLNREREAEYERIAARDRAQRRRSRSPEPSPSPRPIIIRERGERRDRRGGYEASNYSSDSDAHYIPRRRGIQRTRFPREVEEEDLRADAYSFTFSRHSQSALSRDSTAGSISDASENDLDAPDAPPQKRSVDPTEGKTFRVSQSHYTGDGLIGGFQTIELTATQDSGQNSRKGPQPLFKWVQFEDVNMNLDKFESGCARIAGLKGPEKTLLQRLFSRVRRKFDKAFQTSGGSKASFMMPAVVTENIASPQKTPMSTTDATWMCLPYFCLQKYSGTLSGLHPSSHPIRTLLQARFSSVKKDRDMQQAVCRLPSTPAEHCFHIAQVWCIVLDESLVITCSRAPIQQSLLGKSMSISTEPSPPLQTGTKRGRLTHILVTASKYLHWSIPIEECQSWFGFLSYFWEFWPRQLQFCYNGKPIIPAHWPKLHAHASKINVCITLDINPRNKEPARGVIQATDYVGVPDDSTSQTQTTSQDGTSAKKTTEHSTPRNEATKPTRPSHSKDDLNDSSRLHPETSSKNVAHTGSSPAIEVDKAEHEFHLFTFINELEPASISIADPEGAQSNPTISADVVTMNVKDDLGEMDRFLKHQTGFVEALAYKECPQHTRREVYKFLASQEKEILSLTESDVGRQMFEQQVDLVNSAEAIFAFFLPPSFEGPTVNRFWGAMYEAVDFLSPKRSNVREGRERTAPPRRVVLTGPPFFPTWSRGAQYFKEIISHANTPERSAIGIPDDLSKAWLHLIMALAFSMKSYPAEAEEHVQKYERLLDDGMRQVMSSLKPTSLLSKLVLMPHDLSKFMNMVLLGDITVSTTAQPLDIYESYLEYLSILEMEIERRPLDRGHQDKITRFKQEMVVIAENLSMQSRILNRIQHQSGDGARLQFQREPIRLGTGAADPIATAYQAGKIDADADYPGYRPPPARPTGKRTAEPTRTYPTYGPQYSYPTPEPAAPRLHPLARERNYRSYMAEETPPPAYTPNSFTPAITETSKVLGSQLDPTDSKGLQGMLFLESQAIISRKFRGFIELYDRASELEVWNIQKIDYNKDRQESAIYAFTVVTIIFLPLSTVAGILGMNVNDVRNMEFNQWVFWVTAIPLTFIIITLCLVWAGEFGNFWSGFSNLWKGKKERVPVPDRGYYGAMQETTSMMDPRMESPPVQRERYNTLYGRRKAPINVEYEDGW